MDLRKREHGLEKGPGYNWDLLVTGLILVLCSFLGTPLPSPALQN